MKELLLIVFSLVAFNASATDVPGECRYNYNIVTNKNDQKAQLIAQKTDLQLLQLLRMQNEAKKAHRDSTAKYN